MLLKAKLDNICLTVPRVLNIAIYSEPSTLWIFQIYHHRAGLTDGWSHHKVKYFK